jgi:predicted dehydrogenase
MKSLRTKDPSKRLLRVAVVGAGEMGSHHLRIYSGLKGVELVGVVDPDPARAERATTLYGCRAFQSLANVAECIDAASVAVPSSLHAEVAGFLLERGIHCLVEKPLATTEIDCLALIAKAQERNLVLLVGHVERFNPMVEQLGRVLSSAQIHAFDVSRMSAWSSRIGDVDVVIDLMVHDIDVVLALAHGEVREVFAHGVRTAGESDADYVSATLSFEDGSIASLTASRITQNKIRELRVTSDMGFISADYLSQELLIYRQAEMSAIDDPTSEGDYVLDLSMERVLVRTAEPLVAEIQHFVAAVQNGTAPLVSGNDALRAMRIAWQIQGLASAPVGNTRV